MTEKLDENWQPLSEIVKRLAEKLAREQVKRRPSRRVKEIAGNCSMRWESRIGKADSLMVPAERGR